MTYMKWDGLAPFVARLELAARGGLREQFALWLEAMGMDFLEIIRDEIIRSETVDTRRLLNSFDRGDSKNIWIITDGGLTLEIGTNVEYAEYANSGHWTTKDGVEARWVPGTWSGSRFDYDPGAKTGMLLKRKWVEGSHYWDHAIAIFERTFERALERKLEQWLRVQFG